MLKYVGYDIVFQEFPDEVTIALNLSLCPNRCPGCHSSYLQGDVGNELNKKEIKKLLSDFKKEVTCLGFMGGDNDPQSVVELATFIKEEFNNTIKVGWYSGCVNLPKRFDTTPFNYIKLGPYIEAKGPLNKKTTNQHLYKFTKNKEKEDITYRFYTR